MNFGKGIVIAFVLFTAFVATLVTVCMREDISLVSKNYYQEELDYQSEIDQLQNFESLTEKPVIAVRNSSLEVDYANFGKVEKATLSVTRPSDARFDAVIAIEKGTEPVRSFDLSQFPKGKYNVALSWTIDGKKYLSKESIVL